MLRRGGFSGIFSFVLPLLALLVLAAPANAASWCRADPILKVDGKQVQILVSIPHEYVALVDGPTRVEVKAPQQVTRQLIAMDSGLNNTGYDFSFSDIGDSDARMTSTSYRIWVHAKPNLKTSVTVPVMVEVIEADGATTTYFGTQTSGAQSYVTIER